MNQSTLYFIYSPSVADDLDRVLEHPLLVEQAIQLRKIKLVDLKALHMAQMISHALVWVEESELEQVLSVAVDKNISLGLLPIKGQEGCAFYNSLGLGNDFDTNLAIALQDQPIGIDLISCNEMIVTSDIRMLNQSIMSEFISNPTDAGWWRRQEFVFKRFFHAFELRPYPVTLTTAKGKVVSTAITGLALLDFEKFKPIANSFGSSVSLRDQHLSIALFSPQSILGYLKMNSQSLVKKESTPKNLGYIRTTSLLIKSPIELQYYVNEKKISTKELQIQVLGQGVMVNVSEQFREADFLSDDKESVSCEQLPHSDAKIKYLQQSLPFFPHAQEADFKDLFLALKENAKTTGTFVLLMILSSMLATVGLFLNSPAVVIGAMVLAPLMSPIISLSMGLQRSNSDLSKQAFSTLLIGTLIALSLSAVMAAIFPMHSMTHEIQGRLNPSILDLLVAVLAGVAGAFASSRESVAKSFPGVAIAVALVPPLCVAGIGLGWLNSDVFFGAMLLYITNLAGIILAAGISFMAIGFAPFTRAKKGILVSLIFVAIISVPLVISFQNMRQIDSIQSQLSRRSYQAAGETLGLRNIKVHLGKPMTISADLLAQSSPSSAAVSALKTQLKAKLQRPVKFDFSVHLVD
ncbi:MAG: DUF389 domain-containing protein [Methyloprofundus sp.]|nr:DUF389 domain-containing protein [Methyloprofundus sp.]